MRMNTSYAGAQAIVLPITGRTEKMGARRAAKQASRIFTCLRWIETDRAVVQGFGIKDYSLETTERT